MLLCFYVSLVCHNLLHYFVQQSIGVVLYAAEVLHDGIEDSELHGLVDKEMYYYANVTNLLQYISFYEGSSLFG